MKECPYCFGEIPERASKCKHCGEWVTNTSTSCSAAPYARGGGASLGRFFRGRSLDETLNEGVKLYAGYRIVAGIIGFIVFLIVFFAFILPGMQGSSVGGLPTGW